MEAYTGFSYVYDRFMQDMPYEEWAVYIKGKLEENGIYSQDSTVAELGCGTGAFTNELARMGYNMIGIDNSEDMLAVASSADGQDYNSEEGNNRIIYTLQNMTEFELPYEADAVVSVCDSMNYLSQDGALDECLRASYQALRSRGVILFDMKKEEFYRKELADNTFADSMEDCAYIWNNYYDADSMINEYELSVFIEKDDGSYNRCNEYHVQRAYATGQVEAALKKAGFVNVQILEHSIDGENLERIYYMAVKP